MLRLCNRVRRRSAARIRGLQVECCGWAAPTCNRIEPFGLRSFHAQTCHSYPMQPRTPSRCPDTRKPDSPKPATACPGLDPGRSGQAAGPVQADRRVVRLRRGQLHHREVWPRTAARAARPFAGAGLHSRPSHVHLRRRPGQTQMVVDECLFARRQRQAGLRLHHPRPDLR